jgi:acetyl-CoA carboxylase biotin carboxyl carrier protein
MSWVGRVEKILGVLKGSSIGELELAEGEYEIIVHRNPGDLVIVQANNHDGIHHADEHITTHNRIIEMKAFLTGIYYATPSPTAAPFISVGSSVKVGQTVALIEAMKVFNEIQSEVAGRVVEIKARDGNVVKQGDVLLHIEPL